MPALQKSNAGPGFAIYVHWPFCKAKCPYCDFNSHVRHGGVDQARFTAAYLRELNHFAARTGARMVDSIFFGGGTPSLMQPETVAAILNEIARLWRLAPDCEITLEANPTSVEAGRFADYRAAGVNRVSLGVQSLSDDALKSLGRLHSAGEAVAAFDLAREIFPRVSFDLIYARPHQQVAAWRAELGQALALAIDHLSLYQLTIEAGTAFFDLERAGKLKVPGEDHARALYDATQEACQAAGLPAYEISNHARPGAQSRHNLLYWRYGDYAGIGAGAHGRITQGDSRFATVCARLPEVWLEQVEARGHGLVADEVLERAEQAHEFLVMGLRLTEGIDPERYARLAGRPLEAARVDGLVDLGLLALTPGGRLCATREGRLVLNALIGELAA